MAQTPIPPGSYIYLDVEDENDPESPLRAFLFKNEPDPQEDEPFVDLASSFGADVQQFLWLVGSCAQFHGVHRYCSNKAKARIERAGVEL